LLHVEGKTTIQLAGFNGNDKAGMVVVMVTCTVAETVEQSGDSDDAKREMALAFSTESTRDGYGGGTRGAPVGTVSIGGTTKYRATRS
jgi:hypothetical protein